jgi:hypothetical protein
VEDQIDAAKVIGIMFVDKTRIGIFGLMADLWFLIAFSKAMIL